MVSIRDHKAMTGTSPADDKGRGGFTWSPPHYVGNDKIACQADGQFWGITIAYPTKFEIERLDGTHVDSMEMNAGYVLAPTPDKPCYNMVFRQVSPAPTNLSSISPMYIVGAVGIAIAIVAIVIYVKKKKHKK